MLAVAGIALAAQTASAQQNTYNAYGDVLLEFKATGAANDVIFDVGSISQFMNGSSFDLNTIGYNSSFLSNVGANSSLQWAVISAVNNNTPKSVAVTDEGGLGGNVSAFGANAAAAGAASQVNNTGGAYHAIAGSGVLSPTAVKMATSTANGYTSSGDDLAGNLNGNATVVNGDFGSADATATFELFHGTGAAQLLGTFDFNQTTGDLSFAGNPALAAVPEPSTYGLLAGAGLLVLSLRRQLGNRGQA
jgi:hypothetical protein